ncbi:MAG: Crp/Fnr family transcriptional regulator [Anaerolineae bacterium]|nr:Crp/Fnr family transcriptional regulator [Anaerolineae bacterium]MDQ7033341.1 Crp/Fnr family transcriptional regulator [Anaerolineae bacterium]
MNIQNLNRVRKTVPIKTSLQDYLFKLIYFEDLAEDDIKTLVDVAILRDYPSHETISYEGDTAKGLWIIIKGRIKISNLNENGAEHILHILGLGDTFNDFAAFDGGNNPGNAIALSDVSLCLIPAEYLKHLIETDGKFALKVVSILGHRIRNLVGHIEDLALHSVIVRLSRFLLKQMEVPSLNGVGVTRTVIAAHLATTP